MGGAKKAGKAKKASKAQRDAPYAWVTDCDGVGGFTLGGVIPLRSGFDVHLLMLRTGDGVRDGYHKGGQPTDVRDTQREWTSRAVKFPLSAAYELFVRGALDRTPAPGPPVDALREIAFFRSFSSPLAPEHARLVFARPSEETLARAGSRGLSNTSDVFESLGLSSSKVEAAVDAVWNTLKDEENRAGCTLGDMWYVNRGQLLDLGLDPDAFFASTREEARVKVVAALGSSPVHVDRHATMTHHTSVIFDLAGDKAQAEAFATVRDLGLTAYEMSSVSMHIVRLTLCALVQDHRRHGGPRHYSGRNRRRGAVAATDFSAASDFFAAPDCFAAPDLSAASDLFAAPDGGRPRRHDGRHHRGGDAAADGGAAARRADRPRRRRRRRRPRARRRRRRVAPPAPAARAAHAPRRDLWHRRERRGDSEALREPHGRRARRALRRPGARLHTSARRNEGGVGITAT